MAVSTKTVQLGLAIPNLGRNASCFVVDEICQRAETYGFAHIWVADHVVLPARYDSPYPFSGSLGVQPGEPILDPLAVLAYAAARTQRVRLGFSILVTPLRNPIVTAKALVTLDVLSRGRLIYGSGAGWLEEEFEALDAPFDRRGAVTEEYVQIFKELCISEGPIGFAGEHYTYEGITFSPPPVQRPHPPVWIGGNSEAAMRRAVRIGDGWQPARLPPQELRDKAETLREWLHDAGGEQEDLAVSVRLDSRFGRPGGDRHETGVGGSPDEMLEGLGRYAAAGAAHIVLTPIGPDPASVIEQVDRLGEEILPHVDTLTV